MQVPMPTQEELAPVQVPVQLLVPVPAPAQEELAQVQVQQQARCETDSEGSGAMQSRWPATQPQRQNEKRVAAVCGARKVIQ